MMKQILFFSLVIAGSFAFGQSIREDAIYNTPIHDNYIRLAYDNNLFVGSDNNYTQGASLDFSFDALKYNPLNYLLPFKKHPATKFAISIRHHVYTPTDLSATEIQVNERPYAAVMSIKSMNFHYFSNKSSLISTSIEVGLIGEIAKGQEIQTYIHTKTNGTIPLGWGNQISNELIINYGINFSQKLLRNKIISINGIGEANLGNVYTNLTLGVNINLGYQNDFFDRSANTKKFESYVFYHPMISLIGYNATLQGSIFNEKSIYTISNENMNRFLVKQKIGIYSRFNKLFTEFSIGYSSMEIKTSSSYLWGGVKIGYIF